MKRFLVVLLIGLAGMTLLMGCGKKQEQPQTEQAAPAATDTTTAPAETTQAPTGGGK